MKRIICLIISLILIFSAVSCQNERGAYELLSSFVHAYRAEGIVYSSYANEGEEGYIDRELFDKIYVHSGRVPDDFSIFLASHTDSYSECGVFNCRDAQMLSEVVEMCEERVRLLDSERGFVSRSYNTVFYSTMRDKERAKRIWEGIIGH